MDTIPGGAYKNSSGGWHDAEGKALTAEQIAAAERLIATEQQRLDDLEAARAERDPDALKALAAMLRPPVAQPVARVSSKRVSE